FRGSVTHGVEERVQSSSTSGDSSWSASFDRSGQYVGTSAICVSSSGLHGYQQVPQSKSATANGGTSVVAGCPVSTNVVAGGFNSGGLLVRSSSAFSDSSWQTSLTNGTTSTPTVWTTAICLSG